MIGTVPSNLVLGIQLPRRRSKTTFIYDDSLYSFVLREWTRTQVVLTSRTSHLHTSTERCSRTDGNAVGLVHRSPVAASKLIIPSPILSNHRHVCVRVHLPFGQAGCPTSVDNQQTIAILIGYSQQRCGMLLITIRTAVLTLTHGFLPFHITQKCRWVSNKNSSI